VSSASSALVCGQAAAAGIPARVIGTAGGERIEAKGAFDVAVADATTTYRTALPNLLANS
jgi:hypothetical protein